MDYPCLMFWPPAWKRFLSGLKKKKKVKSMWSSLVLEFVGVRLNKMFGIDANFVLWVLKRPQEGFFHRRRRDDDLVAQTIRLSYTKA